MRDLSQVERKTIGGEPIEVEEKGARIDRNCLNRTWGEVVKDVGLQALTRGAS